jgi:phosphoglucomutase
VSPNPENPEGFCLAVELAEKVGSDLIIGTDPDADRIGTMVRRGDSYVPVTGNQLGVLLIDYIINGRRAKGSMPENPGVVASIVTTSMARAVCEANNVHFEDTFTGFKYMAERVAAWEAAGTYQYIFAYEESYGYMMGDYVRDKDAVTASMMVAEMAAYYHKKGMTLLDAMYALNEKYGWFKEYTLNLVMPGLDGLQKMRDLMAQLRKNPPKEIGGQTVIRTRDYADGSIYVAGLGKVGVTPFHGSNVLYFELADGSSFIVRPSGTEPKIKIYLLVRGDDEGQCEWRIEKYKRYAESVKR